MDLKIAARMIAVLAIAGTMIAAVMVLREDDTEVAPVLPLRNPGGEPVRSELLRCLDLGMAAAGDPACMKAWAENRRRFFERSEPPRPAEPKPERFGATPPTTDNRLPERPVPADDGGPAREDVPVGEDGDDQAETDEVPLP